VVPVPAIFTRGRWECRDYKESGAVDNQILDFTDKQQHNSNSSSNLVGNVADSTGVNTAPSAFQLAGVPSTVNGGGVNFIIGGSGASNSNVSEAGTQPSDFLSPSTSSMPHAHSVSMPNAAAASSADGSAAVVSNVVAIDNKIEQAMDLVKTHLTFAVREEVEILRSTIADLEAKVIRIRFI